MRRSFTALENSDGVLQKLPCTAVGDCPHGCVYLFYADAELGRTDSGSMKRSRRLDGLEHEAGTDRHSILVEEELINR